MFGSTGAPIAAYLVKLDDPRIDRTKRHKLLDIVATAICGTIGGADNWVDIEFFGFVNRSGLGPSWSCPTASPLMIPSEMSSRGWTQSSFNAVSWSGSRPWPNSPKAKWWPSTARRCAAPMTAPWAKGLSIWSTCGRLLQLFGLRPDQGGGEIQ